jgi:alkylation response protein AidB-like acyl-CoA dehydrogenase
VTKVAGVLDAVRRTAKERIASQAARIDGERAFPDDNVKALAEAGGLGLVVPVDDGGAGGALAALAEACETLGSACASTAMVFLMHSVTAATVAAGGGEAIGLVFGAVAPFFLVGLAAVNVGIASAAATAATAHAAQPRYANGSSLAEIQHIQHLLADMDLATRQARLLVREAARLGEAGDDAALVTIMEAKVAATDAAATVTQKALEATGGQGYTPALPIERHLRDGRAGAVMAPTNAVLRNWIGKALAGLPVP